MCLEIKRISSKKEVERLKKGVKVKKDFIVYKTLDFYNSSYRSPFRSFKYEKGYHYYQTEDKFGIHSEYDYFSKRHFISIDEGLHAYTNLKEALRRAYFSCMIVVGMVIPKGSTVYFSSNKQEVVSDNLIFYEDAKTHKKCV